MSGDVSRREVSMIKCTVINIHIHIYTHTNVYTYSFGSLINKVNNMNALLCMCIKYV